LGFSLETEGYFRDDDYDVIDLFFSTLEPLAPDESVEVILTAEINNRVDVGIYNGKIKVEANGVEKEIDLAVERLAKFRSNPRKYCSSEEV